MIFADASALVAILAQEDDAVLLSERLKDSRQRFYSAIVQWETITALCRSYQLDPVFAADSVVAFLHGLKFEIVPIGYREANLAAEASRRFGRGRHSAALNMGDCFAYACAKSCGAALLYKGDDFAKTDLA